MTLFLATSAVKFTVNHPPLSLLFFFFYFFFFFFSVTSGRHTSRTLSPLFFFSITSSQHQIITSNLESKFLAFSTTYIGRQLYLPSKATQCWKMCLHEFYRSYACGHLFPKLRQPERAAYFKDPRPNISIPKSLTCNAVKLALKFYHDQVVYLPADMNCGSKVEIPRSCPVVHSLPNGTTQEAMNEAIEGQWAADLRLRNAMMVNGLALDQERQIVRDAEVPDRCSNRAKPGDHNPALLRLHKLLDYPQNMHAHCLSVKAYQERDRRHMMPNVIYFDVDFGCGGPFSAKCLTGWDSTRLLTHRIHLWGDGFTHPRPCNDECLAGWSGSDLNDYRQQIWRGDHAVGWRDLQDYSATAHKWLVDRTVEGQQWWSPLDYSNISHRHTEQWKLPELWDGSEFINLPLPPPNPEVSRKRVPECVWVPVPRQLRQILTKEKPKTEETPEMALQRGLAAREAFKAKLCKDHPLQQKNAVVKESQTTFQFRRQARPQG